MELAKRTESARRATASANREEPVQAGSADRAQWARWSASSIPEESADWAKSARQVGSADSAASRQVGNRATSREGSGAAAEVSRAGPTDLVEQCPAGTVQQVAGRCTVVGADHRGAVSGSGRAGTTGPAALVPVAGFPMAEVWVALEGGVIPVAATPVPAESTEAESTEAGRADPMEVRAGARGPDRSPGYRAAVGIRRRSPSADAEYASAVRSRATDRVGGCRDPHRSRTECRRCRHGDRSRPIPLTVRRSRCLHPGRRFFRAAGLRPSQPGPVDRDDHPRESSRSTPR